MADKRQFSDAVAALRGLTADQIAARLDELESEEAELRVLLRSARARERVRQQAAESKRGKEAAHV